MFLVNANYVYMENVTLIVNYYFASGFKVTICFEFSQSIWVPLQIDVKICIKCSVSLWKYWQH